MIHSRLTGRRLTAAIGVVSAVALALSGTTAATAAPEGVIGTAVGATVVPDQYVVVLKDSLSTQGTTTSLAARYGGTVKATWQHALHGFAITTSAANARRLAADPAVASVSQDAKISAVDTQPNPPSWGLDRVDQRDLPLDGGFTYSTTAANVHAYILDSGIRTTHTTFGGRATWGFNAVDTNDVDCNGHGTHVAGTVGGAEYGVAKGVQLVAVKVLDCGGSGTFAGVISGVDWVTANAIKPAVANMSLGAGASAATAPLEAAVRNSISSGVTYALASGNSNSDACAFSPALVGEAITVNASDINDQRASFSNFGTCSDLYAPGVSITSSWSTSDTANVTISGTSMATPHTAGVAAAYLATHPGDSPAAVQSALVSAATPDKIVDPGPGSPNRLLFNGSGPTPPAKVDVVRYWGPPDHVTSTTGAPGNYQREGSLGFGYTAQVPGSHPLYRCRIAWDNFTSYDPGCEGQVPLGLLAYLLDSPTGATVPVYRCLVWGSGDHMESPDPNCEGQLTEGLLGYTLR
jgi:subtilisin family serine protease